ncbi:heparin lyase I family protein [Caballeronia sp. LZ031]|nr:heparin lyase I family protein [Caballeronia sp. LZ031]MDR5839651.1 heparin lyase I family protein [Caballeronia sp. LZ031]
MSCRTLHSLLAGVLVVFSVAGCAAIVSPSYRTVYSTDWSGGIDSRIGIQSATPGAIEVVVDPKRPARRAVRTSIAIDDDFSHVANGSPRAELVFSRVASIAGGRDYLIRWSTYLPETLVFDARQAQIITQIHQGAASGPPPIMLTLDNATYTFSERGGQHTEHGRGPRLCCAAEDRGKWVEWTLRYVPDATGARAVTQLWKDGRIVYDSKGAPNAYPDDRQAYFKLGLYKPGWHREMSKIDRMTVYYGPMSIEISRENDKYSEGILTEWSR